MSFEVATGYISLVVKDETGPGVAQATRKVSDEVDSSAKKSSLSLSGYVKGLAPLGEAVAGVFAVDKVKDFFAESIQGARESQKTNAQTEAVLKSTGDAAHTTAKQVEELAFAISNKTGVDHNQIQSSENMLLTFTNVRNAVGKGNDIFNQATQTVTDMSVALGEDSKSAAIQLGKALNDPIKGITALQRVGVSFTDAQKKQIASMVKAGNTMGAQKMILHELNKEFGGSAAAQATAGDKMKNTWKNFEDEIGQKLLPIIDAFENWISQHLLPAIISLSDWIQTHVVPVLKDMGQWVQQNSGWLKPLAGIVLGILAAVKLWTMAQELLNAVLEANPIILIVSGLAALVIGLKLAYDKVGWFRDLVQGAWDVIKTASLWLWHNVLDPMWQGIKLGIEMVVGYIKVEVAIWEAIFKAIAAVAKWLWKNVLEPAWQGIKLGISLLVDYIKVQIAIWEAIFKAIAAVAQWLWKNIISPVFDGIKETISAAIHVISTVIGGALSGIKAAWSSVWNGIKFFVSTIWSGISTVVGDGIHGIVSVITTVGSAISRAWSSIWNGIKSTVVNIVNGLGSIISGIWGGITSGLKSVINGGIDIINAAIRGINHMIDIANDLPFVNIPHISPIPHLWTGGWIHGPGSATSDSIPAMLSNGEFVVNAHAASANAALLEAMNRGASFSSAGGSLGGGSVGGGDTYVIESLTIDAKTMQEFNDIVQFFQNTKQIVRSQRGASFRRVS